MCKVRISARLLVLIILSPAVLAFAQTLSKQEAAVVHSIDEEAPAAVALLERIVNMNSGTYNTAGVLEVGKVFEKEFQTLGFATRWVPMDSVQRAPSLVAEHKGTSGKRVLLIGHMDTVFEPSSPFQKFVRTGETATGPGTSDMKGGIVVMLSALKALKSAGALDGAAITVFLTGDEESAGEPIEVSRREFIEAGKKSDCVLSFEPLLFFLVDSLPASANCSRTDDQGSPRSFGSRPSAINWPNLVILNSSLRCLFKLISFN